MDGSHSRNGKKRQRLYWKEHRRFSALDPKDQRDVAAILETKHNLLFADEADWTMTDKEIFITVMAHAGITSQPKDLKEFK